jgi:hypothetical protein
MGSMSASDAAPLPRLGEVYFDVRGESRSMRLSWYADTGVAVFSIWQGGTCTGTFRLPIADLPRMVQALQRGPEGHSGSEEERRAGHARHGGPAPELDPRYPGGRSSSRHRDELTEEYQERPGAGYPGSGRSGGYPDEPGERYSEGRRASGHRAAPYADEPAGVHRSEDDPYANGEADDRYGHEPAGRHRDDSLPGGHYDDGLPRAHHDDDSLFRAYRDDSLPGGHEQEQARQYPGDRSGGYEREPTAAYSRGRYDDEPTGVYRGDLPHESYEDDGGGRYAEREYPGDPLAADYPTGPSALDYPGTGDARGYPASSGEPGYSPARPYVTPRSREAGPPEEAGAYEPRRSRGRRDDEAVPGSFP